MLRYRNFSFICLILHRHGACPLLLSTLVPNVTLKAIESSTQNLRWVRACLPRIFFLVLLWRPTRVSMTTWIFIWIAFHADQTTYWLMTFSRTNEFDATHTKGVPRWLCSLGGEARLHPMAVPYPRGCNSRPWTDLSPLVTSPRPYMPTLSRNSPDVYPRFALSSLISSART